MQLQRSINQSPRTFAGAAAIGFLFAIGGCARSLPTYRLADGRLQQVKVISDPSSAVLEHNLNGWSVAAEKTSLELKQVDGAAVPGKTPDAWWRLILPAGHHSMQVVPHVFTFNYANGSSSDVSLAPGTRDFDVAAGHIYDVSASVHPIQNSDSAFVDIQINDRAAKGTSP